MDNLLILIQLVIAFGIFNVWIVRVNKATAWRGGNATTMAEEFRVYGLSDSMRSIVGALKLSSAALLLIGIWLPALAKLAAVVIGVLMLAAVYMHFKVADPVRKSIPAFTMFMLSMAVLLFRG
jgi:hypothetical protein